MNDFVKAILPDMYSGKELNQRLAVLPPFDPSIRNAPDTERLIALQTVYDIFVPTQMSREIYSKLYLALLHSLNKKQTIYAVKQANVNSKIIRQQSYESILGGKDAFTIISPSGCGKSSAVSRAIRLLMPETFIVSDNVKMIPCLIVQAPADSSVKGLLFEILRKVDEHLETMYFPNAQRTRATVDILIGTVSQIALNHIGLLIVDEIQNIVNSKNGGAIVGVLTQMINNSGVSICMIGTPESTMFFQKAMMLARRSVGLTYQQMDYGEEFILFCRILLKYIYVREFNCGEETIIRWLYQHSQGNVSVVVSLLHDAQEAAILNGTDKLDIAALNYAYDARLTMLHDFISIETKRPIARKRRNKKTAEEKIPDFSHFADIGEILYEAKQCGIDAITALQKYDIKIEEVFVI